MVALGLIGLLVAVSVPSLTRQASRTRLQAVTRQTVGLLSLARSLAISSHQDHQVVVDPQRGELWIVKAGSTDPSDHVVRVPPAVTVELQVAGQPIPQSAVVFRSSGALAGRTATVVLASRDQRKTVQVSSATGAIVILE